MKILTNQISIVLLAILMVSSIFSIETYAQKKVRTRIKAYHLKMNNGDREISMELISGSGKSMKPVINGTLLLNILNEEEEPFKIELNTNNEGKAFLVIEKDYKIPKDSDGYMNIKVNYAGNDSLKSSKRGLSFMDLNLDLAFSIVDSVRTLSVFAYEVDSLGQKAPVAEIPVIIGVERLYSTLTLDKIESNKKGKASIEFPNDLPGDSIGLINVIATIADHDDYGSLVKSQEVSWGTPVDYTVPSNGRSLFGEEAPMWMIIAVFVVLLGAWYHFMLALIKVIQMYRLGKTVSSNQEL